MTRGDGGGCNANVLFNEGESGPIEGTWSVDLAQLYARAHIILDADFTAQLGKSDHLLTHINILAQ